MKIALLVGHHIKSKGALSKYFGLREFDFYSEVIKYIPGIKVYYHNENISGYTTRIKDTAKRLNKGNYDLVIELHFNAFSSSDANGCETLYFYNSKPSKYYAELFSETINDYTGIKLRNGGIKALTNRKDRGFASVYYPLAPVILIEPFFGTSQSDCEKIDSAENLGCIINEFLEQIR